MALKFTSGDMFESQSEAIVNTVNCVGVMGKGVALEFKRRWPDNFKQYKKLCAAKKLTPGLVFIYQRADLLDDDNPKFIINFPTKNHWREKSKLHYIEDGLDNLIPQLEFFGIKSVSMPPLGCGNGGLEWSDVREVIERKLSTVNNVDFLIYGPKAAEITPEYAIKDHKMTRERAILIKTIGEFEKYFGGHLTRISLQKIVYFLQVMGLNYRAEFAKFDHGPYAEELKTVFRALEDQGYIEGYETEEITATNGAFAEAEEYLVNHGNQDSEEIVDRLALLIEGFESPYGMELLSSVHFLVDREKQSSVEEVVGSIKAWNDDKSNKFPPETIKIAFSRLQEDNFVAA